jgi:hypothetical protein
VDIAKNYQDQDPSRDSDKQQPQSEKVQFPPGVSQADDITPRRNSYQQPPDNGGVNFLPGQSPASPERASYEEPGYREHASGGQAPLPTSDSRRQRAYSPAYQQPFWPTAYAQPLQVPQPQPPAYAQPSAYVQPRPPAYVQPQVPQPQQWAAYPPNGAYYPGYYPYYYAPPQQVAYNGQGYYPYAGYYGYYGYPPYQYPYPYPYYYYQLAKPKRDGYLLGVNIAALVCSILVVLGGLLWGLLSIAAANGIAQNIHVDQLFGSFIFVSAFTVVWLTGGGFSIYHAIRSLVYRRSRAFKLPQFWIFLAAYGGIVIIGLILSAFNASVANIPFTVLLIALAGFLPAATFLALGVRRLSTPLQNLWTTTWRRVTLAVLSGATSAVMLAIVFELISQIILGISLNLENLSNQQNPQVLLHNPRVIVYLFVSAAVVAPIVEEGLKPLAAVLLVKRVSSAAEAFTLGLACGIGFDLIETFEYIGGGYSDWLNVALERSTAGLLHGFGAAMTALGWYIITHPEQLDVRKRRYWLGFGCILYAMVQHAIWNGTSVLLILLPAPVGTFFQNGTIPLGFFKLDSGILVTIVLSIPMLIFFIFVTGRVKAFSNKNRNKPNVPVPQPFSQGMPVPAPA